MSLFDAYIFVDWSAANRPSPLRPRRDAIWVGYLTRRSEPEEKYCRTRHEAVTYVKSLLLKQINNESRVLVGFDFEYGYPFGFAQAIGLRSGSGWAETWCELTSRIEDDENNKSNRFEVAAELNRAAGNGGPFWGCPAKKDIPGLRPTSPGFPFPAERGVTLKRLRIVEARLTGVQEAWKLFGNGAVGSQALVGIPRVCGLRRDTDFINVSRVWPFETGFNERPSPDKGAWVLHAEIWPGLVNAEVSRLMEVNSSLIRDQAQVRALCQWAAREDSQGTFGRFFTRPAGLTDEETDICIKEEGWVLGAS
jgi:hypothetical protein